MIPPILTSRHLQIYLLLYKKDGIDFIILVSTDIQSLTILIALAQLVEHWSPKPGVVGSIPTCI